MKALLTRTGGSRLAVLGILLAAIVTLGACGGGSSSDNSSDNADETTTTDAPPPTFPPEAEAQFLAAMKDSRLGPLTGLSDEEKITDGRTICAQLKDGKTGREVLDDLLTHDTAKGGEQYNATMIGVSVGALCTDQNDQAHKGLS